MANEKFVESKWFPEKRLIVTQLSGDIETRDITQWERTLNEALNQIEDKQTFKIIINSLGLNPGDIQTHQKYRSVVPTILAAYGWKVGYVNLFEEAADMKFSTTRGIRCVAAAHVHHDAGKMGMYDTSFGNAKERYFNDLISARNWICNLKVS